VAGGVRVSIEPWGSCIGCGVCEAICPEVFRVDDGRGLAVIVDEYSEGGGSGVVPEELGVCVERAADACPVNVIRFARQ